jgi:hypothetical protein
MFHVNIIISIKANRESGLLNLAVINNSIILKGNKLSCFYKVKMQLQVLQSKECWERERPKKENLLIFYDVKICCINISFLGLVNAKYIKNK